MTRKRFEARNYNGYDWAIWDLDNNAWLENTDDHINASKEEVEAAAEALNSEL